MKKLIIFVLTIFLTFTIIITGKSANAQITEITPYYGGDILNGKELYLFQNYSSTPNFENGYISKKTISQQDVYYQENSFYNGWYKDLGRDLIDSFTEPEHEPENPYFWFYIPLNNLTAQYLQLALIMPEPYESDFYLKFKDETPINFLTTNGDGDYLITPPTTNMVKEIEWICYSVYYQDYLASFRPLTAEIAYDFGFSAGENVGFTRGHNVGYNTGYQNGLQDAMEQGAEVQYVQIQNYNQLLNVQEGQQTINTLVFSSYSATQKVIVDVRQTVPQQTRFAVGSYTSSNVTGHKFYLFGAPSNGSSGTYSLVDTWQDTNYYDRGNGVIYTATSNSVVCFIQIGVNTPIGIYDFYPKLIDLTLMYGEGREPDLETCQQIFSKTAVYEYSTGTIANVGYPNGYSQGYYEGIEVGKNMQATTQLTSTGWISGIFDGIGALLNLQILPGVTIGIIVGIPFIISLAYFVIRAFRGGGGD